MKEYLFHSIFILFSIVIYFYRNNLAEKLNLMDLPDNLRKSHFKAVPAIGGLIIFPYIVSSLIYLNFQSFIKIKILLIWIFIYFSFFITGVIDDKIHLNAKSKSFILLFILFIVLPLDKGLIVNVLDFKDIKYVILLNQGGLFFTIFCIYFFYNALNFSDGLNGISLSLALFFLIALLIAGNEINIFYISIIISIILTLVPNLFGKIFIGNSGVSFLSSVLFLIFIDFYNKNNIFFDEIMLIVFLPAIDAARITLERIFNGTSPFSSDKNHFHHLLSKIIKKDFVFIPYMLLAISPYLATKVNITSYYSLILFTIIYFLLLIYLKRNNV
tara:strand:- start:35 stop:1021 length:987 start_codon:yes stop_codon:yes gene_type:complete